VVPERLHIKPDRGRLGGMKQCTDGHGHSRTQPFRQVIREGVNAETAIKTLLPFRRLDNIGGGVPASVTPRNGGRIVKDPDPWLAVRGPLIIPVRGVLAERELFL